MLEVGGNRELPGSSFPWLASVCVTCRFHAVWGDRIATLTSLIQSHSISPRTLCGVGDPVCVCGRNLAILRCCNRKGPGGVGGGLRVFLC